MSNDNEQKMPEDYAVGYGRPPKQTRYKKGQSGNPAGRRKGSLNLSTVLLATLNEKVVVIGKGGRKKRITKLEVLVKQLVNKAAGGDLRALTHVTALKLQIEQNVERELDSGKVLNELDRKMILSLLKQYDPPKE